MSPLVACAITSIVCLLCGCWMGWLAAKGSQNAFWPVLVAVAVWLLFILPTLQS